VSRNFHIREATQDDSKNIRLLVYGLSKKYIAHEFSPEGAQALLRSMTPDKIQSYIQSGYRYHVAEIEGQIVGAVAVLKNVHLYHLFVAEEYQRQGLAKRLLQTALKSCLAKGNKGPFTVNASKYALPIYEKLGFVATSEAVEKNGVVAIPMQYEIGP